MNKVKKQILQIILILIFGTVVGGGIITLTYLIPQDWMREQFLASYDSFEQEGKYATVIKGEASSQLDNFTDALMLGTAYYNDEENIFKNAMLAPRIKHQDNNPTASLLKYMESLSDESIDGLKKVTYERYWHGYLTFLKPMLCFFNYSEIRISNMFVQLLLLMCIICLLYKRIPNYVLPFTLGILILTPVVLPLSLQFSACFYISVIAGIVLLWKEEKIVGKYESLYFLIIGMCTSYFDLLTYPIVTFAFPMLILIAMKRQEWQKSVREEFVYGFCWCIGFVVQWAGKWILGSVIANENIIKNAADQINYRSGVGQDLTYFRVLKANIDVFFCNKFYLFLWLIFALIMIYQLIQGITDAKMKKMIKLNIPFIIVALIPFIWYFITKNHAYEHFWFASRNLAVSVFAVCCCFANSRNIVKDKKIVADIKTIFKKH